MVTGGMVLSAKTYLRFVNVTLNWNLTASDEDFVRHYFGLNDNLEQITMLHQQG